MIWDWIRNEVSGATRSLRYDLKRDKSHFQTDIIYPEYDAYTRRPRRILATSGIAALAVGGVAATYFVLSAGLSGLILNSSTNDMPSNPFPAVTNSDGKIVVVPPTKGASGAPQPAPSPSPGPPTPPGNGRTTVGASPPDNPATTAPPDPDPGTTSPGSGDSGSTISVSALPTKAIMSTPNTIAA